MKINASFLDKKKVDTINYLKKVAFDMAISPNSL